MVGRRTADGGPHRRGRRPVVTSACADTPSRSQADDAVTNVVRAVIELAHALIKAAAVAASTAGPASVITKSDPKPIKAKVPHCQ
jgi:hypothetical protein